MLDQLLVFPLIDDGEPRALLIVTESRYLDELADSLTLILAAVSEPAAQIISSHRIAYEQLMRQAIAFKPSEIGMIARRVSDRVAQARVLSIDLAAVVAQVSAAAPHIDPFRAWQDVLRVLAALFASSASVCDARDLKAIAILHTQYEDDTELIIQHCASTLRHYLPELDSVPTIPFDRADYPADGEDLSELIGSML